MKNSEEIIFVAAGEKIQLFNRRFSSVPMKYEFTAKATKSEPLTGSVETHYRSIFFSRPVKSMKLVPNNVVIASMWDTFMTIYVVADCEMEISLPKRKIASVKRILALVGVLVLVAVAVIILQ